MHIVKSYYRQQNESVPIERLIDESGNSITQLQENIKELQKAGICTFKLPLTLLIQKKLATTDTEDKRITKDAWKKHQSFRELEHSLLELILELQNDNNIIQVNLRGLASRLDVNNQKKIRAATLKAIIDAWAEQGWVDVKVHRQDIVRLKSLRVQDYFNFHVTLTSAIIKVIYEKLGNKTNDELQQLEYEIQQLLSEVAQLAQQPKLNQKNLEKALLWLHNQKIIRIAEGLNLFHQSFKLKVIKGANADRSVPPGYSKQVKPHYQEQAQRTHIMVRYGDIDDSLARQQLVQDYFTLSSEKFYEKYSELASPEKELPVTGDDYHKILDGLNESQKNVVFSEDHAIAVIAALALVKPVPLFIELHIWSKLNG